MANTESAPALKPCPFCGSPGLDAFPMNEEGLDGWYEVICANEDCFAVVVEMSKELAVAAWNRRSTEAERDATIEECAKVADFMTSEIKRLHATEFGHVKIGSLLKTSETIASAIRSLRRAGD